MRKKWLRQKEKQFGQKKEVTWMEARRIGPDKPQFSASPPPIMPTQIN